MKEIFEFFDLIIDSVITIFLVFLIMVVFSTIGAFIECYYSTKCNICHEAVNIGEYCKYCGRKMTKENTESKVFYWNIDTTIKDSIK